MRLLPDRLPPRLCATKQEVFFMKTSNLVVLIIALAISTGGFAGINYLFTKIAGSSERASAVLAVRA
jgi:hypothetical protein